MKIIEKLLGIGEDVAGDTKGACALRFNMETAYPGQITSVQDDLPGWAEENRKGIKLGKKIRGIVADMENFPVFHMNLHPSTFFFGIEDVRFRHITGIPFRS